MQPAHLITLSMLVLAISGCDNSGGLTRELAAKLLNEQFAREPSPSKKWEILVLDFRKDGIEGALKAGVIVRYDDYVGKSLGLSDKPDSRKDWMSIRENDNDLCLRTRSPKAPEIGMRYREVTGIAEAMEDGGSLVKYVCEYVLPPEIQPLAPYLVTEFSRTAKLRKYDDGWHVENLDMTNPLAPDR